MLWLNPITKPEFRFRGGRGQTMFHQSQNFSFLFVPYSKNLTKSQSKIMTKMTKSRSVLKFFIVLVKPSWACSWDSHEHLCSWKLHEHAHETFTRTCAWSCHGQDHFIELCALAPISLISAHEHSWTLINGIRSIHEHLWGHCPILKCLWVLMSAHGRSGLILSDPECLFVQFSNNC